MKTYDSCDVFQSFYVTDTSLFCLRILASGILVIALRQLRPNHVAIVRASGTERDCSVFAGKYQQACHPLLQQREIGLSRGFRL